MLDGELKPTSRLTQSNRVLLTTKLTPEGTLEMELPRHWEECMQKIGFGVDRLKGPDDEIGRLRQQRTNFIAGMQALIHGIPAYELDPTDKHLSATCVVLDGRQVQNLIRRDQSNVMRPIIDQIVEPIMNRSRVPGAQIDSFSVLDLLFSGLE